MNSSNQTIMVLPGTFWQIPLIKKIKEKGFRVAVVHPYEGAPAFDYADQIIYADILDKQHCLQAAKEIGAVAIMSDECDIATPTLAYVSGQLGLPSQGEDMAQLYTDKSLMRDFCRDHNLPYPEYKVCETLDEAVAFFKSLNRKMIIKPIDANSSRGVYTIESEAELVAKFEESISFSHHRRAVICERHIGGPEFSVDGIMTPYGHICLAISEKQQFSYNKNLDSDLFFSYYSDKYDYDLLRKIDTTFVEASGLKFGFTHAEYKCEDCVFYLLEIGARGGGNRISSHIVPAMTGIDNYDMLIDMFTGKDIAPIPAQSQLATDKVAVLTFFDTTEVGGKVVAVEGLDFLSANPNILDYKLNFKVGDTIKRPTDGGNRIGYYVACCENKENLDKLKEQVASKFKIIYD